ncbi:amino acid ABC transporter [Rhizobium sp. Leaf384]|uniref:branched-chain amino acid ABC transporter substrate-binding protein n=1 Tax=unclassified Rhizobium TaxID=2613769 RepID=UPI00071336C1|nr:MULTISPECIES: ABC transporter substrate-binding protein [unclassified Rhizobium]KQS79142.1 amino acid ABC transporter [Rhizobium sp. Leaf384]KQS82710.1 amino acid ABC transporter [Rhizobium sp. Leaf383]
MFRVLFVLLPAVALGFAGASGAAAAGLKVGVVAPVEGPLGALGRQVLEGARFQAEARGSEVVSIPETCEAGDAEALKAAVAAAAAEALIGFLCTESLDAVLPTLGGTGVPAISLSVRSDVLMENVRKNGWPFYRLVPNARKETEKLTSVILERWKGEPLALIDDGTIHGRDLVEGVRAALAEMGLTPVFSDTFRPAQEQQVSLVRRLARSGATHVLIGGDRSDVAIIARDAVSEKLSLTLLGGEALDAADQPVPLADGVLAVTLPDPETLPDAAQTAGAMRAANIVPEGYTLPAFAAMSLLEQAKDRALKDGTPLADALSKAAYPTVLGTIRFDAGHELADNPYRLMMWQQGRFIDAPPATE